MIKPNLQAALDAIAFSELGPLLNVDGAQDGYAVIVGSTPKRPILFRDFSDHPRKLITITNAKGEPVMIHGRPLKSTAAGRYQILARYFDAYKRLLKLPDFSPSSQDAIAIQMIREQRALEDAEAGRFSVVVRKCSNIWASLPGAGYGQHENKLTDLQDAYLKAGGVLA